VVEYLNLSLGDQRVHWEQAEARVGLLAASVGKDFWVTRTIRELFSLPGWGEHLSFKGGASLSKAWKLIQRFSEDIDVAIERGHLGFGKELSVSQQNKLRAECSRYINEQLLPALNARFIE
jgi:predicted nucleotidyltransferase component of viral defense system